jgi:hypothetical protein
MGGITGAPVTVVGDTVASLTVTNTLGNTHGLAVGQSSTVLSGGTTSTNLLLDNAGATFSTAATGAPARVMGVADGSNPFDAVNYRQLRQVSQGVASTVAMTNIPQVSEGQTGMVGVGVGSFNGENSLAIGASYRFAPQAVMKASIALSPSGGPAAAGVGAGWAW